MRFYITITLIIKKTVSSEMKKSLFIIFSILLGSAAFSQTEYEALKIGQSDIVGTARYMSMGGAFGALGGDASALKDNPAGLGVYRTGEISMTLNGQSQSANSTWYGTESSDSRPINMKANNVSYIMSVPLWEERSSGLLHSNFSFSYNRVKNFNRVMKANGSTDASFTDFLAGFTGGLVEADLKYVANSYEPYDVDFVPWLSVLAYDGFLIDYSASNPTEWHSAFNGKAVSENLVYETGGISEYSFGWGGNFNNKFFIGANLNMSDLTYRVESVMSEDFTGGGFSLTNILDQNGIGVNLKLGAIYLPTNNIRLGAAVHTPTFYTLSEVGYATLSYSNNIYNESGKTNVPTDGSRQNFNLQSPMQAQLSAAYMFGRKGLISAEYNFINYQGMRFSETNGKRTTFDPENNGQVIDGQLIGGMKQVLSNGHVLKLGAEIKPSENFALRAGYAMMTPVTNPNYTGGKSLRLDDVHTNTEFFTDNGTNYFSVGAGYREATWFIDLSYGLKMQDENFFPYQPIRYDNSADLLPYAASVKTNTHNVALTVGFKM